MELGSNAYALLGLTALVGALVAIVAFALLRGLALVQKILVFHNGRISVRTSPLDGASLQVTFPLVS
jgi:hypothetical protein